MQFKLSTLLLAVLVTAVGCLGGKYGLWMVGHNGPTWQAFLIVSIALLLLIALLGVGGWRILKYALIGPVIAFVLLVARTGGHDPFFIAALLVWSVPLSLFTGSLRFSIEPNVSILKRLAFLLPACFVAAWMLSAVFAVWE